MAAHAPTACPDVENATATELKEGKHTFGGGVGVDESLLTAGLQAPRSL